MPKIKSNEYYTPHLLYRHLQWEATFPTTLAKVLPSNIGSGSSLKLSILPPPELFSLSPRCGMSAHHTHVPYFLLIPNSLRSTTPTTRAKLRAQLFFADTLAREIIAYPPPGVL